MKWKFFLILSLVIGLSASGCAVFEYMDGSSSEKITAFRTEKLSSEAQQREIESLKAQPQSKDEQISTLNNEVSALAAQPEEPLPAAAGEEKIPSPTIKAPKIEETKLFPGLKAPDIKVLSGTGRLAPAKKMSGKLRALGYEVKRVDINPKRFSRTTVFHAPDFAEEAARITEALGGKVVSKPMTWTSIFDIIVVTGEKP